MPLFMRHGAIEPSLEYLADRGNRVIPAMSAIGTSRHFATAQQFGRFRSEADIEPLTEPDF